MPKRKLLALFFLPGGVLDGGSKWLVRILYNYYDRSSLGDESF